MSGISLPILIVLAQQPMTRQKLAEVLDVPVRKLAVLSTLSTSLKRRKKQVYIQRWTGYPERGQCAPQAVFALGDLPDARRPTR